MKLSNEFKVGIMAVVAIVILVLGFNFLKGNNLFSTNTTLYIHVDNVNGLAKSNPVLLYGMNVGTVDDIRMAQKGDGDKRIVVEFHVRPDVTIPNTSVAKIFSKDILNAMAIELFPAEKGEPIKSGDILKGEVSPTFSQNVNNLVSPIQDRVGKLVESIDTIINSLNIVFNHKTRTSLQNSFASVEQTMAHVNNTTIEIEKLTKAQSQRLNAIIANVESISTNLKNNNKAISNVVNNFSNISDSLSKANIKQTLEEANKAVKDVAAMVDKIEKGEGSVGQLLNNKQLYNNLEMASKNLDNLMIDLKAHPKRYVHFSIFGRKDKKEKTK